MSQTSATDVQCPKCDYEWTYTGSMFRATCPSCQHKVRVEQDDE